MTATPLWRAHLPSIVIALIDVFAIGLGMGVPVFAIALGAPVGWWFARRQRADAPIREVARSLLLAGVALAAVSFVALAVVWGPSLHLAFGPDVSASDYGIPLILYGERASMIGWFVLMLVVSPLAQFMTVVVAGVVAHAFGGATTPAE